MSAREGFGSRLAGVVSARGNLCLGIDPHPELLDAWGLDRDADGVEEFSRRALEAFGDLAAAVKPQVALFEEYGSAGIGVLERVLDRIRDSGALSVADAKRGDIGSTMQAYARAWLSDSSPLACDALTVSPYLGVGALDPAFTLAAETGRGLFVLARTSNPEAGVLQNAVIAPERQGDGAADQGPTVARHVVEEVGRRNAGAGEGPGSFGVVIGATLADPPPLDGLGGPVLMPGVGTQGGSLDDVRRIAGAALPHTLVNLSREVLRHGPDISAMRGVVSDLAGAYRFG